MLDLFMFVRPHASSLDAHERLPPSRGTKLQANIWFQILGPEFAADVTIWWRRSARSGKRQHPARKKEPGSVPGSICRRCRRLRQQSGRRILVCPRPDPAKQILRKRRLTRVVKAQQAGTLDGRNSTHGRCPRNAAFVGESSHWQRNVASKHAIDADQKPNSARPTQLNAKRQHAAAAAEASFAIVLAVGMT
jgi:hypothetical protein